MTLCNLTNILCLKPLNSSDHGHQQLDENPFSHLALEIEMDRPTGQSANPFDKGIMPSFDDRAIDEDYRNENAKKFDEDFGRSGRDRKLRTKRPANNEFVPPPLLLDDIIPTDRRLKDVTPTPTSVKDPIHVKKIPDVQEKVDLELDLDDFLPKPPAIVPSVDLKPQINIRSRNAIIQRVDVKRVNVPYRKPVAEPIIIPPETHVTQTKPVIDYFGTQSIVKSSTESKQEIDQKEEYFRESQLEANKILFGVEEPSRPLTNVEVSKRKKLILKLVDQKLKMKLSELMNQLGDRSKATRKADALEQNDSFDDQMLNLVPDSVPDSVPNPQNWAPYPSESSEQSWTNFQSDAPNKDFQGTWPIYQPNPGWGEIPHMNPYPPGVEPMHNIRFPRMPMRPWNPNQWHNHMRPPEPQWQPQHNWNMHCPPVNSNLMQPNILYSPHDDQQAKANLNPYVPPATRLESEKPAADIELELKEKEFLERTLRGSKSNSQRLTDSDRHRTPEKSRRQSRERSRRSSERTRRSIRSRSRGDRKRSSQDRLRDRLKYESRLSTNRSPERIAHRVALSPSRLSPLVASSPGSLGNRSHSIDQYLFEEIGHEFEPPFSELMATYESRTRSRSRDSEDLRVRLSQRRNRDRRSRSPADLRNKLSERHGTDDLRNRLSDRSRHRRSRSRSSNRSSRRTTKSNADAESEWDKFNNIVGMLTNIDKESELTTEEMSEKKEIMRLLLENPDLLELDEKFVYKFGKGRLNLAVKQAENILYPSGMPDERIASLISKKIAGLSTEKKTVSKHDAVPIQWIKLCSIVDQVLKLTVDERKKLSVYDKRMLERDDLLLKISEDPNIFLSLGTKYGHRNVEWAVKYAKKILYHNGVRDVRVDETISKEREKVLNRVQKIQQSRNSSEKHRSGNSSERDSRSKEWSQLSVYVTKLVQSTLEKFEKMSRADVKRRDELLVQMSRDPDAVRADTKFTDNIDKAILNEVIEKCKEVVASVKSNADKIVVEEFERQRTRLINILKSKAPPTSAHDQILSRISSIFKKGQEKLPAKERDLLIEALLKDPESLRTNTKIVERIGDKLAVDDFIADVKKILSQLDPSRTKGPKKFHISSSKVIDIPFVVKIEDASDGLNDKTKTVLLKALRDMITEIENPPKPKLLQQRYIDKRVEVVCANLLTFEWLKRAIVSDFKDKWIGADLKIERVPVETKIPRDKLKFVDVVFKDSRATLPFDDIVKEIKKENSKLYPDRWELQAACGKNGDYKKKTVGIDIESLAALEQMNRFARLGRSLIYFDILYMGNNVPNFEATCQ